MEPDGSRNRIMAVPFARGGDQDLKAGVAGPLFDFISSTIVPQSNQYLYSASSDGSRFLVSIKSSDSRPTLNVVENWEQLITTTQR